MRPPFAYYGSKRRLAQHILQHIPPHRAFVELFGGSGAVTLAKAPSPIEVFNDIFSGVTNFYAVLRNEKLREQLLEQLRLTPYSREDYQACAKSWEMCDDPVEKARQWYFVQANSFNGRFGAGLCISAVKSANNKPLHINAFLEKIEKLPMIARRFNNVIIENDDFRKVVKRYDTVGTVFYADPPYVMRTRNAAGTYHHEATLQDHQDLVTLILQSRGKWVVSGYDHEVYAPLEAQGWQKIIIPISTSTVNYNCSEKNYREEILWVSPPQTHTAPSQPLTSAGNT